MKLKNVGKTLFFTTEVVAKGSLNVVKGMAGTVKTGAKILNYTVHGEHQKTGRLISNKLAGTVTGLEQTANTVGEIVSSATDKQQSFFTSDNANRLASLAPLGIVLFGVSLGIEEALNSEIDTHAINQLPIDTMDGLVPSTDLSSLSIHDGMFTGNAEQLNQLAQAGLIDGTEHINADDIERSYAAREAFLSMHGYDELPQGYDVHHIIPLSEGGADTPNNMVLVSESDHAQITAMQSAYYHW